MKKTKPTKRAIMVMFTMLLLCLGSCKRDPFLPPMPNVLNSYRGTDKMVLQVIEALKAPDNKELLTELEKQGNINWEYKALITSRFLDGITLRFATGINGDYLDAEVDAQTMAVKLYSKQQQEQRDAMAQQAFNKRQAGKSTQAGVCTYNINFEVFASASLSMLQVLNGINNIGNFLSAEGFTITQLGVDPFVGRLGYRVIFMARNNETETDLKSKLDDALLAYSQSRNLVGRAWFVNNLKITSCDNKQLLTQELNAILKPEESFEFTDYVPAGASSFNSVQEFNSYINSNSNFSTSSSNITLEEKLLQCRSWTQTFPPMGEEFYIRVKKNMLNGLWEVVNVASDDVGTPIFSEWHQTTYTVNVSYNIIQILVYGKRHYNVILKGIGTIYRQKKVYRINIDNVSGVLISFSKLQ